MLIKIKNDNIEPKDSIIYATKIFSIGEIFNVIYKDKKN